MENRAKDKSAPFAAVIMAGGEGSRLRPLTCDIPKPMVRLCGRPVIEYILALLEENGVGLAGVSVRYLAESITGRFPEKRFGGVKLCFAGEDRPLGTAGSVRNCVDTFEREQGRGAPLDDVIVVSGDALCDFDLRRAFDFHRSSGAQATIIAKRVEDPREYGLIRTDGGFVSAFIEKPAYSQAVSDLANTGVYILARSCIDMIPEGEKYDFAKDLFPAMLCGGLKIAVCEEKGYWCDIGDLGSYLSCQRDILEGRVRLARPFLRDARGNIAGTDDASGSFTIIPPVYIGRDVHIGDGAVIDRGSVLDDGVIVGEEAHINGSVLLENSTVGSMASLSRAVVCAGAVCKNRSMAFEGAVVGSRAIIGQGARVNPGVKIWPRKNLPDSAVAGTNLRFDSPAVCRFGEDGIEGAAGSELTAELCARIGAAAATVFGKNTRDIAVGGSGSSAAEAFCHAAASGVLSAGSNVYDLGGCTREVFNFGMTLGGLKAGVWIEDGCVHVVQEGGLPAVRAVERGIENALSSGDFTAKDASGFGKTIPVRDAAVLYETSLRGMLGDGEELAKLRVSVADGDGGQGEKKKLLERLLAGAGVKRGGEMTVGLSADGVTLAGDDGAHLSEQRVFGICCMAELEKGAVAVSYGAPRMLDGIAARHGTRLLRYMTCPADDSDSEARRVAALQLWSRDTVMQAVKVLRFMAQNSFTVHRIAELLPDFAVRSRTVPVNANPAGIVGRIGAGQELREGGIGEGALLRSKKGCATLRPLKKGDGIRITAEAESAETAEELCGFYAGEIMRLGRGADAQDKC